MALVEIDPFDQHRVLFPTGAEGRSPILQRSVLSYDPQY